MNTQSGHRNGVLVAVAENASVSGESASFPWKTALGHPVDSDREPETLAPTRRTSQPRLSNSDQRGKRAVLLATKLHVPAVSGELVQRVGLLEMLSAGCGSKKLTLLSAPVGWGKTTLLTQWAWAAQQDQRLGWLSLDASDNDPVWFWSYVIAALQKVEPGVGTRAVELLTMGADPIHVVLPSLLNELDAIACPIALILDDYHLVVNRSIHEQMAFVIGRMPSNLHMVLATRSDPALPLARLRASGELAEIRRKELRFKVIEAGLLLNSILGLNLAEVDVHLLHQRTEGWAAGLYLAALPLVGNSEAVTSIRTFAGDSRHIVDYLTTEVLDCQPPQIRSFLLCTSILRQLSGALCDAVLQRSDSISVLEKLERENLFLVPLDRSRRRYHQLFCEFLLAELHRCEPESVVGLHRRAAAWFESAGLVDDAVRHLLAAGDIAESADLIAAEWADEFNRGGLPTVSGWLDLLPDETVTGDPRLSAIRAWIALETGRFDDARLWMDAVEAGTTEETDLLGAGRAQLVLLRLTHAFKTGDIAAALDASGRVNTPGFGESVQTFSAANATYGAALYFAGCMEESRTVFRHALRATEKVDDRRHRNYALGYLALIAAETGQLDEAEELVRRATDARIDPNGSEHSVDAAVTLAAAVILDVRGDRTGAADAAQRAVELCRKGVGVLELAKALLLRARILTDLGDHETAAASRREATGLLRGCADVHTAQTVLSGSGRGGPMAVTARSAACTGAEELTSKELQVLRLLATRLSRREIGQRLYVSLNTVKSHQRAIHRKLGAADRNSAVARARELGLL